MFNTPLDQLLQDVLFFFFLGGGGETTISIVFSAKHADFKDTPNEKRLCVSTPVLTALVKVFVFFIFHFGGLRNCQFVREMFLIGSQISKSNNMLHKNTKTTTKHMQSKTNLIL